jgi:hypothetical protein
MLRKLRDLNYFEKYENPIVLWTQIQGLINGFGSSPIIPLMLSLLFFIQWLVNYKKQKKYLRSERTN